MSDDRNDLATGGLTHEALPHWSARAAQWAAQYHAGLRDQPVRAMCKAGDTLAALDAAPPETGCAMAEIFADFERLVPQGLTHWQHPRFFAYFPANAAPASMLAEQLVSAMAANAMLWETSPVATEMEMRMVDWLGQALGLGQGRHGLIQDGASGATLCAVLTMRERALRWQGLRGGLSAHPRLRIYASAEAHSSIEKAVRLAGIGSDNLVQVALGETRGMDPEALRDAIAADRAAGHLPAGVIITAGGTSTGAFDPVKDVITVAQEAGLYTHLDAAWSGSAMICPEFRPLWEGAAQADSLVMNPHKWLGANFDCAVQFLKDPQPQIDTMRLRPAYLDGRDADAMPNFSEWSMPLGRRFRALKLWFLLRAHGLEDLRTRIRNHVAWTQMAADRLAKRDGFVITTAPRLALFTFHYRSDAETTALLQRINDAGTIYLTRSIVDGREVIRFSVGQFATQWADIETALRVIEDCAQS